MISLRHLALRGGLWIACCLCLPACKRSQVPALPPADITAPLAVTDLAASGATPTTIDLQWTAPGDDGVLDNATAYDLRFDTAPITDLTWASATAAGGLPAPAAPGILQTATVTGLLPSTAYFFALKTVDDAGNWSGISNGVTGTTAPPPDTTAPLAVTDLAASAVASTTISVQWTAPGDDGVLGSATAYDLRFDLAPITDLTWASAMVAGGLPAPTGAGTLQGAAVPGLTPSTTYFLALKSVDDAGNWSGLSNVLSTTTAPPPDLTPPGDVTTLQVIETAPTALVLQWRSSGDDGAVGTATAYDLRYSASPITAGTWASATPASGEPLPAASGTLQRVTVAGLTTGATYYFALRVSDEAGNLSGLSNVAVGVPRFVPEIAFIADKNADGRNELFVTDGLGSQIVNLSGPLVAGGIVREYLWSPDRQWISFLADKDTFQFPELYVVSALGGTPVKISGGISAAARSSPSFAWASDGSRLAFLGGVAYIGGGGTQELYSVKPDGSLLVKMNAALPSLANVNSFEWAPDASRIAYTAEQDSAGVNELYTVLPDGSGGVKVSAPMGSPSFVDARVAWAPDSSRIAYVADPVQHARWELFTTLPTGATSVIQVSSPMTGMGGVDAFSWAPDGTRIAYRFQASGFGDIELFTGLPLGGTPAKISLPIPPGGYVFPRFYWSPDSLHVAFKVLPGSLPLQLFTGAADGTSTTMLTDRLPLSPPVEGYEWSADGSRIAFVADEVLLNRRDLFTALADGTGKTTVLAPLGSSQGVGSFHWSPDGAFIAYVLWTGDNRMQTLSMTGAPGNGPVSPLTTAAGWIDSLKWHWTRSGGRIVYVADRDVDGIYELYTAYPNGPNDNRKISGALVVDGDVLTIDPP